MSKPNLARIFAAVGAAFIAIQLWGYVGWLLSDEFVAHDTVAPLPPDIADSVQRAELVQVVGAVLWLAFLVVTTVRRKQLTWPLALTLVWVTVYWQDPLVNLVDPVFAYNAEFVDRGDWTRYLPFVPDSAPGLDQPLLMQPLAFAWLIPAVGAATYGLLRLLSRWVRQPVVLVLIAWAAVALFESVFELQGVDQGLLAWRHVTPGLSLSAGEANQWPVYEGVLLGLVWALPGIVLFFRDRLPKVRPVVGLLAASGALNAAFLAYNVVLIWLASSVAAPLDPWFG
ncbi:MAG TPA: spirocyclase AveC family protein [Nocardioidaceae bacterium]|nr:spirocyclase AveC family protein [Nocardioidaceae bacterium]